MKRHLVLLATSAMIVIASASVPLTLHAQDGDRRLAGLSVATAPEGTFDDFRYIVRRNQGLGLLIATGLLTGGITTVTSLSAVTFMTFHGIAHRQSHVPLPMPILVAALVPHGVLELPALVIVGAAGLHGLPAVLAFTQARRSDALAALREGVRMYLLGAAMMLLAAAIEVMVTPRVVGWVLS